MVFSPTYLTLVLELLILHHFHNSFIAIMAPCTTSVQATAPLCASKRKRNQLSFSYSDVISESSEYEDDEDDLEDLDDEKPKVWLSFSKL